MKIYGLIGYPLSHSFSKDYFNNKFKEENITDSYYELFPLNSIDELPALLKREPQIRGLNVTIPYKQSVMNYLDEVSDVSQQIKAVNTISIRQSGSRKILTGHNTDVDGFKRSYKKSIGSIKSGAIILGTGGASRAVQFVLDNLYVDYIVVSRKPSAAEQISYEEISKETFQKYSLIINATPCGMFPDTSSYPKIPYMYLTSENILFDLIYNPGETTFLRLGREKGAKVINGMAMLRYQAERSWDIWNNAEPLK